MRNKPYSAAGTASSYVCFLDAEWLPTTLATKWREADPNKLTFDPSLCTFPSYGLAVSPNAALVVTSHVQLHMRDVKGGSKGAKPSCVISVHATNLPWEVITASELNLNDVGMLTHYCNVVEMGREFYRIFEIIQVGPISTNS